MSKANGLVKNTFIISIGKISTQIISFLLLPLYTAKVSTEDYGNADFVMSIAAFAVPFLTLLLEESMFRFLIDARDEEEKEKILYWFNEIINSESGSGNESGSESGSNDLITSNDDVENTHITVPIIRLLETKYESPLTIKTKTIKISEDETETVEYYLISSAYELWYWNRFVCGTEDDKDVELACDIDMVGYSCKNTGLAFTPFFLLPVTTSLNVV